MRETGLSPRTEIEHSNSANGGSIQTTSRGLMVWRKADNWTAFTDGTMTLVKVGGKVRTKR